MRNPWSIFVVYGKQSEKTSTFAVQKGILPYTFFGDTTEEEKSKIVDKNIYTTSDYELISVQTIE